MNTSVVGVVSVTPCMRMTFARSVVLLPLSVRQVKCMEHRFLMAGRPPCQMDPQQESEKKMPERNSSEKDGEDVVEIEALRDELASAPKDPIVIPALDVIGRSHPLHPEYQATAVSLSNDRRLTK